MNEKWIRNYLNGCEKEALIELYLQMRFERDLYIEMYEEEQNRAKVVERGKDKGWTLDDSKVKYGYELAKKEWKNHGGCWGCLCKDVPFGDETEDKSE